LVVRSVGRVSLPSCSCTGTIVSMARTSLYLTRANFPRYWMCSKELLPSKCLFQSYCEDFSSAVSVLYWGKKYFDLHFSINFSFLNFENFQVSAFVLSRSTQTTLSIRSVMVCNNGMNQVVNILYMSRFFCIFFCFCVLGLQSSYHQFFSVSAMPSYKEYEYWRLWTEPFGCNA
jgi:hypothetical protein